MHISAVICDVDGTLVNTDDQVFAALNHYLASLCGLGISQDQFSNLFGYTAKEWSEDVNGWCGTNISERELWLGIREHFPENGFHLKEGAAELMAAMDRFCLPRILATSSRLFSFKLYTDGLGLEEHFPQVLTREAVENPKPDPEMYLLAARYLGLPPADCLVIEDSEAGAEAAVRAGCWTAFVPNPYIPDPDQVAMRVGVRHYGSLGQVAAELALP